jgi:Domain of unknown function (DUF4157)
MHDYELDLANRPSHPAPDKVGADRSAEPAPAAPGVRAPHHDAASLMHLQRTAGNAGVVQLLADDEAANSSPVHDVVGKGGGTALDEGTRSSMEGRFGQSFEDVRVHTDGQASKSAESVGANAYTVGSDIVFRSGQFDTSSSTGQRTLAHELTHVVQQRSGPVDGTDAPGGIKLSDPSDRFEQAAEQTASQVMSMPASPSSSTSSSDASAQRELEEDPAVQMLVQRDELGSEEEEDELPG